MNSKNANHKKEKQKQLNSLMKECVKEWCEDTTSHGFKNMVKTDSWLIRITWIILIIASMSYCVYSIFLKVFNLMLTKKKKFNKCKNFYYICNKSYIEII